MSRVGGETIFIPAPRVVVSLAVEGLTVRSNFMLLHKKFLMHASCLELYLLTVSGKGNRRAKYA